MGSRTVNVIWSQRQFLSGLDWVVNARFGNRFRALFQCG